MIRNTLSIVFTIAFVSYLFVMCRKAGTDNSNPQPRHLTETAEKVNNWLAVQLSSADSFSKLRIASLQASLDYDHLYTEDYGRGQTFIVVPTLDKFVSLNNASKNPKNVLLLFVTDTGIRKG